MFLCSTFLHALIFHFTILRLVALQTALLLWLPSQDICLTYLSLYPLLVIDNSWEKPNKKKVWTVQLPSKQRHRHWEHPRGSREEVRGQQGVGGEDRMVWQQMDWGTLNWENQPLEDALSHIQMLCVYLWYKIGLFYYFEAHFNVDFEFYQDCILCFNIIVDL